MLVAREVVAAPEPLEELGHGHLLDACVLEVPRYGAPDVILPVLGNLELLRSFFGSFFMEDRAASPVGELSFSRNDVVSVPLESRRRRCCHRSAGNPSLAIKFYLRLSQQKCAWRSHQYICRSFFGLAVNEFVLSTTGLLSPLPSPITLGCLKYFYDIEKENIFFAARTKLVSRAKRKGKEKRYPHRV